ncbi:MAG: 6-bladed beta-propeller [Candidatus Aminicenantales bacterium]
MRETKSLLLTCLGIILILGWVHAIIVSSATFPGQKIEIKTEGGVTVVRNPKVPVPQPDGPSKLVLTQDLVIGKEPVGGSPLFGELRSLGVDDKENIWTLDWEDDKVRIFDKTGALISTFGKKGQGPAEWENPNRMIVTPDGTGVILDTRKLTLYSPGGECLKEISTAKARMFRFKIDSRGMIYADQMDFGEKLMLKLIKYDPALNPIATIAEVEEPFKSGTISPFPILLYCHVTADDRLIWMANLKYEFHVLSPEGKPLRRVIKDHERVRVKEADKKRILDEQYGDAPFRDQIVFPDVFPPVFFFIGDPEGRLYSQTYETDDKGWLLHDVFDKEGRCITRFSLPHDEMPFVVNKDKLYVLIQEDDTGVPLVKRYSMEWK